jgi:hypothetical protein
VTLPSDPGDGPAPRKGFGAAFWTAMAAALILILAGGVIGFFGPVLFPPHSHPARIPPPRLGNPPPSG